MQVEHGDALVLGVTPFGEHDAMVHLLCPERGRLRGLVKRGRHMAAVLQPFNNVRYERFRRLEGQLGTLDVELTISRAPLWMSGGAGAYVCAYVAELLLHVLPEDQAYPHLAEAVLALLAHAPMHWQHVVAFDVFLLESLGYGLRLHDPVLADADDVVAYVSPRSGRSVGRRAAAGYETRLIDLPALLGGPDRPADADCACAFRLTAAFLPKALPGHVAFASLLARGRMVAYYDRSIRMEPTKDTRHEPLSDCAA